MPDRKLIVVGLDGVSYSLLSRLINEGRLDALRETFVESVSGPLRSTILPNTAAGWSSSFTGVNPGRTGIFGFFNETNGQRHWRPVNSNDRRVKDVWQYCSEKGLECIILGMPMTYPPRPINGVLVGGYFSENLRQAVYPESIRDEVLDRYRYALFPEQEDRLEAFETSVANRFHLAEHYIRSRDWNLFMVGFEQLEIMHHNWLNSSEAKVARAYDIFAQYLADFIRAYAKDLPVLVYSDHGHRTYRYTFNLLNYLVSLELLKTKPHSFIHSLINTRRKERVSRLAGEKGVKRALVELLLKADKPLRQRLSKVKRFFPRLRSPRFLNVGGVEEVLDLLEHDQSIAYPYPNASGCYGGICVNDRADVQNVIEKLYSINRQLQKKVVRRVWRREELFHGGYVGSFPELVIELDEPYKAVVQQSAILSGEVIIEGLFSDHELYGMFLGYGTPFACCLSTEMNMVDVMPVICYLLELPVPEGLDGRVPPQIIDADYMRNYPPRYEDVDLSYFASGMTQDDEQTLLDRLSGLGYIG